MTAPVEIKYRCACMTKDRTLAIRARLDREDIASWIDEVVVPAISKDHRTFSPLCVSPKTEYIKLPVHKGKHLGAADPQAGTA